MGNVWLTWAADAARNAVRGTPYKVIEVAGWQTRGHGGYRVVEGIVGHHTATSDKAAGDYPSLNIVSNGRSDLPGPLCTYGLGRSGNIYVVAAGVAWHAGASAYGGFTDLNDEFAGVEAESAGLGGWTAAQRDSYPRLVGAFLSYIRRDASRYCSHRGCALPKGRKPDPTGIDDAWMINSARTFMSGATIQEDDLTPEESRMLAVVYEKVSKPLPTRLDYGLLGMVAPNPRPMDDMFGMTLNADARAFETRELVRALRSEVATVRAEVAALKSSGGSPGSLSEADVARIAAAVNADTAKRMQS